MGGGEREAAECAPSTLRHLMFPLWISANNGLAWFKPEILTRLDFKLQIGLLYNEICVSSQCAAMDRTCMSSTSKFAVYTRALYISFTLCWPFALTLSRECVCDCWPSVAVVKLLVRVAILLCELKCFATHSNKNICTHAHTHSHTHTHSFSQQRIEQVEPFESCHVLACHFRD